MKIYSIREVARETKIGMESIKRACEEGLIKASKLTNGVWRIAETSLQEALHNGINFQAIPKKTGKKNPIPVGLKKAHEAQKAKKASQEIKSPSKKK